MVVTARVVERGGPARTTMALVFGGTGLVLAPWLFVGGVPGWLLSPAGVGVGLYMGLVGTAAAYLLYGRALRSLPVPLVSTLLLAEPACAAILGVTLLGERLDAVSGVGFALMGIALGAAASGSSRGDQYEVSSSSSV